MHEQDQTRALRSALCCEPDHESKGEPKGLRSEEALINISPHVGDLMPRGRRHRGAVLSPTRLL